MGLARSGTTKMQKVLAASGDFNYFTFWQGFNWASISGEPNEPTGQRIAEAEEFCRWFDERSAQAKLGHSFEALEPEEDEPLSEGASSRPASSATPRCRVTGAGSGAASRCPVRVPAGRDAVHAVAGAGAPIGHGSSSRPRTAQELEILKVFPRRPVRDGAPLAAQDGAVDVHARRYFRQAYGTSTPDPMLLMEHAAASMEAQRDIRQACPDLPLLDLLFDDIVGDLETVVERVYGHAGMTLSEESRDRMLRWDEQNAMHKLGTFEYSSPRSAWTRPSSATGCAATSSCSISSPTDVAHARADRRVSAVSSPERSLEPVSGRPSSLRRSGRDRRPGRRAGVPRVLRAVDARRGR